MRWRGEAFGSCKGCSSTIATMEAAAGAHGELVVARHRPAAPCCSPSPCAPLDVAVHLLLVRREFVEHMFPTFKQHNPQIAMEAVVQRGKHPGLHAEYREPPLHFRPPTARLPLRCLFSAAVAASLPRCVSSKEKYWTPPAARPSPRDTVNKTTRHVDLRNQAPEEVLRQAVYLRSSLGRKASLQASTQHVCG